MTTAPEHWSSQRLDAVADVRLGHQRSPKNHTGPNMWPYLRAANVDWDGLKLDDIKQMNFSDDEMTIYRLQPGDIVLGEASGSPAEVGKPALWKGEVADCAFQNTLLRVRSRDPDPRYLLHWLRHLALSGAFAAESRGVGIHHIGRAKLAAWVVPLPPLDEQRRIVEILEDHLSCLDAAGSYLNASAQRIASLTESVLVNLDELKSADRTLVSDVIGGLRHDRSVPTADQGFPVLRLTAIRDGRIDLSQRKIGSWSRTDAEPYLVQEGDFLVARGSGSRSLVGRGGLVVGDPDAVAYPDTAIRVRPNTDLLDAEYLAIIWDSREVRQQIESAARTTAGIYKINQTDLRRVVIPLPTCQTQRAVAAQMHDMTEARARLAAQVQATRLRCETLRRSLLAAAFSGRLTGSVAGDDVIEELAGV